MQRCWTGRMTACSSIQIMTFWFRWMRIMPLASAVIKRLSGSVTRVRRCSHATHARRRNSAMNTSLGVVIWSRGYVQCEGNNIMYTVSGKHSDSLRRWRRAAHFPPSEYKMLGSLHSCPVLHSLPESKAAVLDNFLHSLLYARTVPSPPLSQSIQGTMPAIPTSQQPACDNNIYVITTVRIFAVFGLTCSLRVLYQAARWSMPSLFGSVIDRKYHSSLLQSPSCPC